jgi:eukaryotic-like serine/threonine-protein kinase
MGTVWVARHRELGSEVALKLIRRAFATSPAALDRLLREARTAAGFHHPNIVRVYDFGRTSSGDPYIVMERLVGVTLSAFLRGRGRLSGVQAVRILLPVLSAIVAAHEKGVIHRDVKPENVFLSEQDGGLTPKLLDFGIARATTDGAQRITADGAILGSPDYLSPEQAQGSADVDERSDTWAICVTLYELITGELPFKGRNYNGIMRSIVQDAPRPTTEFAAGDAGLWRILERGLQKEPAERYQTARALARELARWALTSGVEVDISGKAIATNWSESAGRGSTDGHHGSQLEAPSASLAPSSGDRVLRPLAATLRVEDQASKAITLVRSSPIRERPSRLVAGIRAAVAVVFGIVLAFAGAGVLAVRSGHATVAPQAERPSVEDHLERDPVAAPTRAGAAATKAGFPETPCLRSASEQSRAP